MDLELKSERRDTRHDAERRERSAPRLVAISVAAILVAATVLKVWELISNPASFGRDLPGWAQISILEFEIFLAIWLVSKRSRVMAHLFAMLTFGAFAVANGVKSWSGAESCGCFGVVHVSPILMLLVDIIAVAALGWTIPVNLTTGSPIKLTQPRSSWLLIAGISVLAIGVTLHFTLMPRGASTAYVTTDETEHNFGVVMPGQTLSHSFSLRNSHPLPIEIVNVRSNCGCTAARDAAGTIVQPGETVPVRVTLETGEGGSRYGDVYVYYNVQGYPIPGKLTLSVRADVLKNYTISPAALDFGTVTSGAKVTETLRLTTREISIDLLTAESAHPAFSVSVLPNTNGSKHERELIVTFNSSAWQGTGILTSAVALKIPGDHNPFRTVPIQARVDRAFEVDPSVVVVDSQARGACRRKIAMVSSRPFRVMTAASSGGVAIEGRDMAAHCDHHIDILIADTGKAGFVGEIRLEIAFEGGAAPEARAVTVPVYRLMSN